MDFGVGTTCPNSDLATPSGLLEFHIGSFHQPSEEAHLIPQEIIGKASPSSEKHVWGEILDISHVNIMGTKTIKLFLPNPFSILQPE